MKRTATLFSVFALTVAFFSTSIAQAKAVDMFLKLTGTKTNKTITTKISCPDGACTKATWTVDNLPPDVYKVCVVDSKGNPIKFSSDCTAAFESTITAREAGSGMATGRRQYQPLIIHRDLAARDLNSSSFTELDASSSVCTVSGSLCVSNDGKPMAIDSWSWGTSNSSGR